MCGDCYTSYQAAQLGQSVRCAVCRGKLGNNPFVDRRLIAVGDRLFPSGAVTERDVTNIEVSPGSQQVIHND